MWGLRQDFLNELQGHLPEGALLTVLAEEKQRIHLHATTGEFCGVLEGRTSLRTAKDNHAARFGPVRGHKVKTAHIGTVITGHCDALDSGVVGCWIGETGGIIGRHRAVRVNVVGTQPEHHGNNHTKDT